MLTRQGAWIRFEMRLPESAYTPLGFAAGDTNLYRYVGNDPTNATDPSGLEQDITVTPIADPPAPTTPLNGIPFDKKLLKPATLELDKTPGKAASITFYPLAEVKSSGGGSPIFRLRGPNRMR